ncbi:MAG: hypothetical protein NWS01_12220 [Burkholderiales bacterium]|nr:hypothetical protein [Burkholderiales bacterium]
MRNMLVGAVTGFGASALAKESLAAGAEKMRSLMIKGSSTFAGVVDSPRKVRNNQSGGSAGINVGGVTVGGTRVDLDGLCGLDNSRCEIPKKPDGTADTTKPIVFTGGRRDDGTPKQSLAEFLATTEGQKMSGPTGGVQGMKGTLFGVPYPPGSWQEKLIEAFGGTHDMIGGKLSGLYDEQGNIKRGMSATKTNAYDAYSVVAIVPAAPFATAEGFSPEVWKAIGIPLKTGQ